MIPTAGWIVRSPARLIAFGFGSGLLRPAPGTWGTLAGWAGYQLLLAPLGEPARLLVIAAAFAIGVWACGKTGRDLGVADHGGMVWDEVAAIWLVLAFVPAGWAAQFAAFLLFRFFDIVKPPPIRYFDQRLKNGFGVMFDDLLAAGFVLLVWAIWSRVMT
jgi:phosphatidylglycerophosphatase A